MCGLTGVWRIGVSPIDDGVLHQNVVHMAATLQRRGPDGDGAWVDGSSGFAVAHRRLAIVDLTAAGRQPMFSSNGRWVIVFNGEIYNHMALRVVIESSGSAPIWRGHSDTETLLAAFELWGGEVTLPRCVGI